MRNRRTISEGGFSLLEVLLSLGVLAIVAVSMTTLMAEQNKQIKQMSQKIILNDLKNGLITVMQNTSICAANLDFT